MNSGMFISTFIVFIVAVVVNAKPQEGSTDPQTPVQKNQTDYVAASMKTIFHNNLNYFSISIYVKILIF